MKHRKPHNPQWAHQIETMLAEWAVPLALVIATVLIITIIIPTGIDIYQSWGNIEAKERAKTGIELIQLVATIVGGIAIFWNIIIARRQLVATQEQNITDRFSRAVEQLGHDEASVRIGGIYALERISQDSSRDYWSIMEILSAFVRDQRGLPPQGGIAESPIQLGRDVQAAITVLGRRDRNQDPGNGILYLTSVDLRKMTFDRGDYTSIRFQHADLREANFYRATLQDARLWDAKLTKATLLDADLRNAYLVDADLQQADMRNCILTGADIQRANFAGAGGLTVNQVKSAKNWQEATYSNEFLILLGAVAEEPK